MSYSFGICAATKAEASEKVAEKLAEVVAAQPIRAADQEQAQAAADSFIALVRDDDTQDIAVTVSGSVIGGDAGLNSASVSVGVLLRAKVADVD